MARHEESKAPGASSTWGFFLVSSHHDHASYAFTVRASLIHACVDAALTITLRHFDLHGCFDPENPRRKTVSRRTS